MVNSNTKATFVVCLIFLCFVLYKSEATCPPNMVLRVQSCWNFALWLLDGELGLSPITQWHCCNALEGLDDQVTADCLCLILVWQASGRNYRNTNSSLASAFKFCQKKQPAGYQCIL